MYKVGDEVRVVKEIHGHEFDIDEVVTIVEVSPTGVRDVVDYRCNSENNSWWLRKEEFEPLKEEKPMSTKHDGYVVVELTECTLDFNLTKEQALTLVDRLLYEGVDAENILVFPPNSNLDFVHTVKFIEEDK